VEQAGPEDQEAGKGIIFRQKDKNCSLVDAISFVLMERLHAESAFTFDPHFEQYGFKVLVE
jgi:predicted nucleic acid-binding protein